MEHDRHERNTNETTHNPGHSSTKDIGLQQLQSGIGPGCKQQRHRSPDISSNMGLQDASYSQHQISRSV